MTQEIPDQFLNFNLGIWYPEDCLASVIDDPEEAVRAVEDLQAAGFSTEDVHLFLGPEVVAIEHRLRSSWGFLRRVVYSVASIGTDSLMAQDYVDEARRGRQLLVVHAPKLERAKLARAIVERHHARNVRYYGRWAVADLA